MSEAFQFGVIVQNTVSHEGDERSRTHPGHGYGAYTSTHNEVIEFKDESAFRAWVEKEEAKKYGKKNYRAIAFKPVTITSKTHIDLKF